MTLKYYKINTAKEKNSYRVIPIGFHNLNKCIHLEATGVNHQLYNRDCERTFVIEGYSQTMNSLKQK